MYKNCILSAWIKAKEVRTLLHDGRWDDVARLVPESTLKCLRDIRKQATNAL
jgi:citrate lyase synthetase